MICKHIILYPKNVIHERHWIQFNKCNRYNLLRKKCQMENMNSEKKQERKVRGLFYHYDISAEYSTSSLWEALKSRITINFFWTQNSIQNSHKIFLLAKGSTICRIATHYIAGVSNTRPAKSVYASHAALKIKKVTKIYWKGGTFMLEWPKISFES